MRVGAIKSFKDGVMKYYGDGELIKDQIPDSYPFNEMRVFSPCIKLDTGKYVWGFECWWGSLEEVTNEYKNCAKEIIMVEPNNIQPLANMDVSDPE